MLLNSHKIRPGTKRQGHETFKGYDRKDFEDAFERYLPPDPSQRHNPQKPMPNHVNTPVTDIEDVTDQKLSKSRESLLCDGVTDENPLDAVSTFFEPYNGEPTPEEDAFVEAEERAAIEEIDGRDRVR